MRGEFYWQCKDGRVMHIDEIQPDHAVNILRLLACHRLVFAKMDQDAFSALAFAYSSSVGEYASMAAENEANVLFNADLGYRIEYAQRLFPFAKALRKRLDRFGAQFEESLYRPDACTRKVYDRYL